MAKKQRTHFYIAIANILLLLYCITIGIYAHDAGWTAYLLGFKTEVITILITMFCFELTSTITFQLRIWLTSKNKITPAALLGASSWLIAGIQGLLLINGTIDPLNEISTFFIKMPPVFVATFSGILINNIFLRRVK